VILSLFSRRFLRMSQASVAPLSQIFCCMTGKFRVAAMRNATLEDYVQHRYLGSILSVSPNNPLRRLVTKKQVQHISDVRKEEAYVAGEPAFTQLVNKTEPGRS
jgi:hypothetical protein